mmetsp:Transcript_23046/g.35650  ORF Transcript_23046/g.35650 Transcript_23046/m.35650 type:complete len:111 (-) Transcript_23046:14-346(-)
MPVRRGESRGRSCEQRSISKTRDPIQSTPEQPRRMQREEAKEAATKPMVHSISELKAESARALQFQIKLVNEQLLSPTLSPTEIDERVKLLGTIYERLDALTAGPVQQQW